MKTGKTILFKGQRLHVIFGNYFTNGNPTIELYDNNFSRYMTATVNIPDVALKHNETIIKDYAENKGIFNALISAEIIKDTGRVAKTAFVTCPIVELIKKDTTK